MCGGGEGGERHAQQINLIKCTLKWLWSVVVQVKEAKVVHDCFITLCIRKRKVHLQEDRDYLACVQEVQ